MLRRSATFWTTLLLLVGGMLLVVGGHPPALALEVAAHLGDEDVHVEQALPIGQDGVLELRKSESEAEGQGQGRRRADAPPVALPPHAYAAHALHGLVGHDPLRPLTVRAAPDAEPPAAPRLRVDRFLSAPAPARAPPAPTRAA